MYKYIQNVRKKYKKYASNNSAQESSLPRPKMLLNPIKLHFLIGLSNILGLRKAGSCFLE